jgi:hypothetical protein
MIREIERCVVVVAVASLLAGCGVGTAPTEERGAAFAIPSKLADPGEKEMEWLFFASPKSEDREVRIRIDGKTVYKNPMPPASFHPDIRSVSTHLASGSHAFTVEDLLSGEMIQTNLVSGSTERIEIRFEPLSVGVYTNATWMYL